MNNHGQPQKITRDVHLIKIFSFIDAGLREPMSTTCVKGSPDKHSLFLKKPQQITFRACFASNFHVIPSHGFYLTILKSAAFYTQRSCLQIAAKLHQKFRSNSAKKIKLFLTINFFQLLATFFYKIQFKKRLSKRYTKIYSPTQ